MSTTEQPKPAQPGAAETAREEQERGDFKCGNVIKV